MKTSIILLFLCFISVQVLIPKASSHEVFVNDRVVGGKNAVPHSAPWIVSMQFGLLSAATRHMCGGSIIASNWVVTAGHCVRGIPSYGTVVVIAGRHNLMINENTEQRRNVNRQKTWIHKMYTSEVGPYDIALIRLDVGFKFNSYVALIRLPFADKEFNGNVRLFGWGSTSTTTAPSMPSILQTVVKPIISFRDCSDAFGTSPLHYTNICTGPLTGGIGACHGDSGGPISQDGVLVGIASWGSFPCGNSPSVYVAVSSFVEWINNIIDFN